MNFSVQPRRIWATPYAAIATPTRPTRKRPNGWSMSLAVVESVLPEEPAPMA